jgi:hypothetical protein
MYATSPKKLTQTETNEKKTEKTKDAKHWRRRRTP